MSSRSSRYQQCHATTTMSQHAMIGCDDDHCPMRQVGHTRRDHNPLRFIEVSATPPSQDTLMQKGTIFHRILIAVGSFENPLDHISRRSLNGGRGGASTMPQMDHASAVAWTVGTRMAPHTKRRCSVRDSRIPTTCSLRRPHAQRFIPFVRIHVFVVELVHYIHFTEKGCKLCFLG